ncbi:MAG: regulatory protein RecX [Ignavibacteria bacterium]|nr:MAG: regulatory protein RecX [Ignavibacteria bacterium]KAF0159931.1 MAG: regulatory protein RecX [Ignavibacteria bacterium]
MKIAALKKKGNNVTVVFDDGTYRVLDYRVVVDYGIWKGQEIDDEKLELLSSESSLLKAKDSAFRFLGMRLHSKAELKLKLLKKKFPLDVIENVLLYLQKENYLNDEEFVIQFSAERVKRKKIGPAKLSAELMKKGINRELIKTLLSSHDQENYFANALTLAEKKLVQIKRKETDPRRIAQKLFTYLASKGYQSDVIRNVVENLKLGNED